MLVSLSYYSVKRIEFNVKNMVLKARRFNVRNNIDGILISYPHKFLQTLEGELDTITELYENIVKDARHDDVTLITKHMITERLYPNWSMALVKDDQPFPLGIDRVTVKALTIDALVRGTHE